MDHIECTCSIVSDSFATPQTVAFQAPLSMGFSRQYWSGLSFPSPGDLLDPGIKPASPDACVDDLAHFQPCASHDLPPGTGCSHPYLYQNARPKDPLRQDSLGLLQSHLFRYSFASSSGDHFALKNYSRRYLQKVHSTFCGHCVCPQNPPTM